MGRLDNTSSGSKDGLPKVVSSKNEEVAEATIGSLEASLTANSSTPSKGFFRIVSLSTLPTLKNSSGSST